jgi:hypothetical protein
LHSLDTVGGVLWCAQEREDFTMVANDVLAAAVDGLRLRRRRTGEYVGPCPHCRVGRERYHVWTLPGANGRPAGRFWCRACGARGLLASPQDEPARSPFERVSPRPLPPSPLPCPAHIPHYRRLYELTALWAHGWLIDDANPEPLRLLARRGVTRAVAERHILAMRSATCRRCPPS